MPDGLRCGAPARKGRALCYWHDPESAEAADEARRLGGMHRRRAKTVAAVWDFAGLRTVEGSQRLLEAAAIETMALENSIPRNRTLIAAAQAAPKLIETAELLARIERLESALGLGDRSTPGDPLDDL
jgi:hypothetical protein